MQIAITTQTNVLDFHLYPALFVAQDIWSMFKNGLALRELSVLIKWKLKSPGFPLNWNKKPPGFP